MRTHTHTHTHTHTQTTQITCMALKHNQLYIVEHPFDVLITDYIGMWGIRDADLFGSYKCRIRVLDSFGTDPLCE